MIYKPWSPKKGSNKNLEAFFTKLAREVLHGNGVCFRNHDIDVQVVPPSRGRVRVFFDGKRSDYLEGEIIARYERLVVDRVEVPQMQWYDTGMRDFSVVEVEQ